MGNIFEVISERGLIAKTICIKNLCKYAVNTKLKIKMEELLDIPLRREHDSYIMDEVEQICNKNEMTRINKFRIWIKVLCLRNICTVDGTDFTDWDMEGSRQNDSRLKCPEIEKTSGKKMEIMVKDNKNAIL